MLWGEQFDVRELNVGYFGAGGLGPRLAVRFDPLL